MKNIILTVSVFAFSIAKLSAQTVDEIVAKNLAATGGVEKLRSVKSIVMESTINIMNMGIENKTTILVNKAVRSDSKIMDNNMVQAFDGVAAWEITPALMGGTGEPQNMSDETAKTVISQLDPFPLLDYAAKGTAIALLGTEKVKDKNAYHIKITTSNNIESELWIDVENGLVCKMKNLQDKQGSEIFLTNYIKVEGINFATATEILTATAGTINVDTKTILINSDIDESVFKMPVKNN